MLSILLVLIIIGVVLFLINTYIPMAAPIKTMINALVVVCVLIWLLQSFGFIHSLHRLR